VDDPYRSWETRGGDEDATCREGSSPASAAISRAPDAICSSVDGGKAPEASPGIRGPSAEAHADDGDYYAGAYLLRGCDPKTGLEVELFSGSIHQGERERAVQVGMARMGGTTDDRHFGARGEVFTAQARVGVDNPDGSIGVGASVGSTVVGAEVTGTVGPVSLTVAAAVGATVGGSVGLRDSDHDGKTEYCARVDFGVGSVGICVEE
jgi:hypothetical protein